MEKAAPFVLDFERPLRTLEERLKSLQEGSVESEIDFADEIKAIEKKIEATKREIYGNLTAWQKVQLARHPRRPYALDYIEKIFDDFHELHGDRQYRDDEALIGGTAFFGDQPVMVLAQQKGRDTKEKVRRNFGMPHPEGYRKALRLMKLAERFKLPVFCLIDTPGAYPGLGSEERHVAEAIAVNLREMAVLEVPVIAIVIGEGGSGGALGIGVADRVLVMEHAYYSVISPEGCAAILWKDKKYAPEAAVALKMTAKDLVEMGIADEIVEEPLGGAHASVEEAIGNVAHALRKNYQAIKARPITKLLDDRYEKYRKMGEYETLPEPVVEEPAETEIEVSEEKAEV